MTQVTGLVDRLYCVLQNVLVNILKKESIFSKWKITKEQGQANSDYFLPSHLTVHEMNILQSDCQIIPVQHNPHHNKYKIPGIKSIPPRNGVKINCKQF